MKEEHKPPVVKKTERKRKNVSTSSPSAEGRMHWNDEKVHYLIETYGMIQKRTGTENGIPKGGWNMIADLFAQKYGINVPRDSFENQWHVQKKL